MALTPYDIQAKRFGRKFRGYDEVEVEAFLAEVSEELEETLEREKGCSAEIELLRVQLTELRSREAAVRNVLEEAKGVADRLRDDAAREAGLLLREAKLKAAEFEEGLRRDESAARASLEKLAAARSLIVSRLTGTILVLQDLIREAEHPDATLPAGREPAAPQPRAKPLPTTPDLCEDDGDALA
jgi:cell division initiation protein